MADKNVDCFEVTVRGSFYSASGKDRVLAGFGPVTFTLPEYVEIPNGKKKIVTKHEDGRETVRWEPQTAKRSVTGENVALWVVQRRLLPTYLAEKHPTAVGFRTCQIIPGGIKRVSKPASQISDPSKQVSEMSIPELVAYCKLKSINVAVSAYTNVDDARLAVQMEIEAVAASNAAPAGEAEEPAAKGVHVAHGAPAGDVPIDHENPADALI